jgi:hypothetical protein
LLPEDLPEPTFFDRITTADAADCVRQAEALPESGSA